MSTSKLFPAPLLSLLALPIWVTTVPLAFFYASAALFLVVATLFAGLQSTGTLAAFAVAFALIMGAPAYVSVVVYIRAAERLAPVEVVTRTRAYHLVIPLLTVGWAVYMAVYLSKGGPHIAIIAAILATYFLLFLVHTYFEPLTSETRPLLPRVPGTAGGLWGALRKHEGWWRRIMCDCWRWVRGRSLSAGEVYMT